MNLKPLYKTKVLEFYTAEVGTALEIPYYEGGVSAGFPSPSEDYMHTKLDLNELLVEHPSATYYVRVNGDSMLGAGIMSATLAALLYELEPEMRILIIERLIHTCY